MDPMLAADEIAAAVGSELERFPHLTFAVLFGSAASGRLRPDSDVDVAVYGASADRLEIEHEREIDRETEIQIALERATQRNVELLILNRSPATVCAAALTSGRVVLLRDGSGVLFAVFPRDHLGGHRLPADRTRVPGDTRPQPLAALRNLMTHEYLDLRFGRITRFVDEGAAAVGELSRLTRSWIK